MTRIMNTLLVLAAVSLVSTACGAAGSPEPDETTPLAAVESSAPASSPSPDPTPTIPVGPVELTGDEATDRFLSIVCPHDASTSLMSALLGEAASEHENGVEPDLTDLKEASAERVRLLQVTSELMKDPYYTWPDDLGEHIDVIRDSHEKSISLYITIANAPSFGVIDNATYPDVWPASVAIQEVWHRLGISPDATDSCHGYETRADELHEEMTERNEYLASFKPEA